jgi:Septum formation
MLGHIQLGEWHCGNVPASGEGTGEADVSMRGKLWRRTVLAALVVVTATLALSGCIATVGSVVVHAAASARKAHDSAKPAKGQCWQSTFADAEDRANWGNRPAISCSAPHQLYTFAVESLDPLYTGKLFDKDGEVQANIWKDAGDRCGFDESSDLPSTDPTVGRIWLEFYVPDEEAWDAGARWVRCDVGVLKVGSSLAHPEFENLESFAALTHALSTDSSQFDFCLDDPGQPLSNGPKGKGAVYANCAQSPQWVLNSYVGLENGSSEAYRTAEEMQGIYVQTCQSQFTDATHVTYPYFPSESDWMSSDRQLECWVGQR